MKDFCTYLGELLVSAGMFSVPILCTCSIVFDWNWLMSVFLISLTLIDYLVFFGCAKGFIDEW